MKKIIIGAFVIALILFPVLGNGTEETTENTENKVETVSVTDDNGDVTEVKVNPDRVVITDIYPLPSVMTVFLGTCEPLVGVHPVSMSAAKNGLLGQLYPDYLNLNTGFMTGGDINIEELLKLNPDVVFYNASKKSQGEMIRNAGIPAIAVSATKWDYDVLETYRQWTSILGQVFPNHNDVSTKVDAYSKDVLNRINERIADLPTADKQNVLFLFNYDENKMITSGKNFFGQWWANAVGAANIAEGVTLDNANAVITMEQVYAWNPDVIFITNFTPCEPEDLFNNAINADDWSDVAAVQAKRVYKMPLGSYRSYTPGVDTPVTLLWLAKMTYPELFKDIDINQETRDYYFKIYGITLTDNQLYTMYNSNRDASKGYVVTV